MIFSINMLLFVAVRTFGYIQCVFSQAAAILTVEEYETKFWPVIQNVLKLLLSEPEGKYSSLSCEEVYGCIFHCVNKQFYERLFNDLCIQVKDYLKCQSSMLQGTGDDYLIDTFDNVLQNFKKTVDGIIPLFSCLNRAYLVSKLKTDMRTVLFQIFTDVLVNDSVCRIVRALEHAHAVSSTVHPSKMASVVKGLYNLCDDYVRLSPNVFAAYIPNTLPPMTLSDLPHFMAETQQFQEDLHNVGFLSCDQSGKSAKEDAVTIAKFAEIRLKEKLENDKKEIQSKLP